MEFTAFKSHIGSCCTPSTLEHLRKELEPYKTNTKDAIRIHMDQPLPEKLVGKLVRFRSKENES